MSRKGQIFSSDFLIGVIVLLFVLTTFQVHQSNLIERIQHQQHLLYRDALISRTDTLIMYEGSPSDWESSTVEVIGLSTGEPNHLNDTKVREFFNISMERSKELLGLRGKDYYFAIENRSGQVISDDGVAYEKGSKTWEESENVYTVRRKVFVEEIGKTSVLWLVVW